LGICQPGSEEAPLSEPLAGVEVGSGVAVGKAVGVGSSVGVAVGPHAVSPTMARIPNNQIKRFDISSSLSV
jgi:hypothetical protein